MVTNELGGRSGAMIAILVIAIVVFFLIGMPIAFGIGAGSTIAILWDGRSAGANRRRNVGALHHWRHR